MEKKGQVSRSRLNSQIVVFFQKREERGDLLVVSHFSLPLQQRQWYRDATALIVTCKHILMYVFNIIMKQNLHIGFWPFPLNLQIF